MIEFLSLPFFLYFFYFLISTVLAFTIPGFLLINKKFSLTSIQIYAISTTVGIVVWAVLGFLAGFLGIRQVMYLYVIIAFFLFIFKVFKKGKNIKSDLKLDKTSLLIILLGLIPLLSGSFINGTYRNGSLSFMFAEKDVIYHSALTNQLIKEFPPTEPAMSGAVVHNYHYLTNLAQADLIRVFRLPLLATQFQYMGIFLSILLGFSAFTFGMIVAKSIKFTRFLLFFLFFAGDAVYILTFLLGKGFNFNISLLYNSIDLWSSPPRIFAATIFFVAVSLIYFLVKEKNYFAGVLGAVLIGSLIGFKVYFGIFALSGVSVLLLFYLLKKDFSLFTSLIPAIIFTLAIFAPVNLGAGGFVFTGPWRVNDFVVNPGLGLSSLVSAQQVFLAKNNYPKLLIVLLIEFSVYFVFLFGTTIFGIFQTKKSLSLIPKEMHLLFLGGISVSLILGSFFIQKVGGANTSQFLSTVMVFCSVYAALSAFYIASKLSRSLSVVFVITLVILTVPRVIYASISHYNLFLRNGGVVIDSEQIQALNFLKKNSKPADVVLADTKGLDIETTCHYISFLSDRSQYVCDGEGILKDHAIDAIKRIDIQEKIFSSNFDSKDLRNNKIDYLYVPRNKEYSFNKYARKIYENKKVYIYKIIKS